MEKPYLNVELQLQENDALHDLVWRAMATPDNEPLYEVAIGAITSWEAIEDCTIIAGQTIETMKL